MFLSIKEYKKILSFKNIFFIVLLIIIPVFIIYLSNLNVNKKISALEKKNNQGFDILFLSIDKIKYDKVNFNTRKMPIQEYMEDVLDTHNGLMNKIKTIKELINKQ